DRRFFERIRGLGVDSELPVFVVGMPRSGTTLVEQILASHPDVFGAGELVELPRLIEGLPGRLHTPTGFPACLARIEPDSVRAMAAEYLQYLSAKAGAARRATDKLPENYLHLGVIAKLFPRARVIHCRRDPLDVCVSCYLQNF